MKYAMHCALLLTAACQTSTTYGNVQTQNATLQLSATALVADGADTVSISVTVEHPTSFAGATLALQISGCVCAMQPAQAVLDGNAQARVLLSSTTPGTCSISATSLTQSGITAPLASPVLPLAIVAPTGPQNVFAGAATDLTVIVRRASGAVWNDYHGQLIFASTDTQATLPAPQTLVPAAGGYLFAPGALVLRTAGTQAVYGTDATTGGVVWSTRIAVAPAAPATLTLQQPAQITAGQAASVHVQVTDTYGNVTPSYTGTVSLQSSDAAARLPAPYTFTAADAGAHSFATVTWLTAGPQSCTARDPANNRLLAQGETQVNAGPLAALMLAAPPATATAGQAQNLALLAVDAFGNRVTDYAGDVIVGSTDQAAILPSALAFDDAGILPLSVTWVTAGTQQLTFGSGALTLMQALNVVAAAPDHIAVTPAAATLTVGANLQINVTVQDRFSNTVTGYRGTIKLTPSDGAAELLAPFHTFTPADAGAATFAMVFHTAGNQTLRAADVVTGIAGLYGPVTLQAGSMVGFAFSGLPSVSVAGQPHRITLTAVDSFSNALQDYIGTVHFSSTDLQAGLPVDTRFAAADAGVIDATLTLKTAGTAWSVTAQDVNNSTFVGVANPLAVTAAAAARLAFLRTPASNTLCTPLSPAVQVGAVDAYGNGVGWQAPVILRLASGVSPLVGTLQQSPVTDVATFADISLPRTGPVTLRASSAGLAAAVSLPIAVIPSAPQLTVNSVSGTSGSIAVNATVTSACPVALTLAVNPNAGTTYRAASVVNAADMGWVQAATGATVQLVWDSPQQMGHQNNAQVPLALTATGSNGAAVAYVTTAVNNGVAFAPAALVAAGTQQTALALADINHDGHLDLLTTDSAQGLCYSVLGDGSGGFGSAVAFSCGAAPSDLLTVDINHDGATDVVTADGAAGVVNVLLGNGAGGFAAALPSVFTLPQQVRSADIDRDGHADILVTSGADTLSWAFGHGDGTFFNTASLNLGNAPGGLAVGDVNRDGRVDAVVVNPAGGGIWVALNSGSAFATPSAYSTAASPRFVALADVNGDGALDAIVTHAAGELVFLAGGGDGTFASPVVSTVGGAGPIDAVDADGDGHLDVVTTAGATALVAQGHGDGTFSATAAQATHSAPLNNVAVGDINRDGQPDVVGAGRTGLSFVLLNAQPRPLQHRLWTPHLLPASATHGFAVPCDLNEDGRQDLLTFAYGATPGQLYYFAGDGNGGFAAPVTYAVEAQPEAVQVTDFNGDGHADVAVSSALTGTILVFTGDGHGNLRLTSTPFAGGGAAGFAVGDIDGDGLPDMAVALSTENGLAVLLNQGSGLFTTLLPVAVPGGPIDVAVGDVNNDGLLDVAVANNYTKNVSVYLGDGTGALSLHGKSSSVIGSGIGLVDINHDGNLDLITSIGAILALGDGQGNFSFIAQVGRSSPFGMADFDRDGNIDFYGGTPANGIGPGGLIAMGDGLGHFNVVSIAADSPTQGPAATPDVNNDGYPDLVQPVNGGFYVIINDGTGVFPHTPYVSTTVAQQDLVVTDFNQDGYLDALVADSGNNGVNSPQPGFWAMAGNGVGSFTGATFYSISQSARRIAAGDVNGDGWLDVLTTDSTANSLDPWLQNTSTHAFAAGSSLAINAPAGVMLVDMNGDAILDALVGMPAAVQLAQGAGNGTWLTPSNFVGQAGCVGFDIGDLDHNGTQDGVAACASGVVVQLGTANGLSSGASRTLALGNAIGVQLADLDGDDNLDLVITLTPTGLATAMGIGDGTFAALTTYTALYGGLGTCVGDLNGDGAPDVVLTPTSGSVAVFMGSAQGVFAAPDYLRNYPLGAYCALADMNRDGKVDIVISGLYQNVTFTEVIAGM